MIEEKIYKRTALPISPLTVTRFLKTIVPHLSKYVTIKEGYYIPDTTHLVCPITDGCVGVSRDNIDMNIPVQYVTDDDILLDEEGSFVGTKQNLQLHKDEAVITLFVYYKLVGLWLMNNVSNVHRLRLCDVLYPDTVFDNVVMSSTTMSHALENLLSAAATNAVYDINQHYPFNLITVEAKRVMLMITVKEHYKLYEEAEQ